ncbi:hypothetical protein HII31_08149 [Pseudocercospora fuligena]|uniref:DUF3253 domain-containing protein n=1 Tax=Pseudocercospora fuligena TaxID=685502 RepID=A0A8H6VGC9_9PEZI|nr:hypothetical protein HII31_08149 [Pseudocercospora fuligena]
MPEDGSDGEHAILKRHLTDFLRKREPPKTFCPSEVARACSAAELTELGFASWRDAMPAIRDIAWQMRESGDLEILQKGNSVGGVGPDEVTGPIRIRRTAG